MLYIFIFVLGLYVVATRPSAAFQEALTSRADCPDLLVQVGPKISFSFLFSIFIILKNPGNLKSDKESECSKLELKCKGSLMNRFIIRTSSVLKTIHINRCFSSSKNITEIQKEFTQQSSWFENDWELRSVNSTDVIMRWVLKQINEVSPLSELSNANALDVACGTGIFARSLAPFCSSVIGLDATDAMLEQARNSKASLSSSSPYLPITYVCGDANSMPFESGTFDVVTCRLAVHHFSRPRDIMEEMVRVCKPGGRVCIVDITSPTEPSAALELNRLERLRDPTHTRSLTAMELVELLEGQGLDVLKKSPEDIEVFSNAMDLQQWMASTRTPPHAQVQIERSVRIEIEGGSRTGMNLSFLHRTMGCRCNSCTNGCALWA